MCWFKQEEDPEKFMMRHINEMKRIKAERKEEFERYRKEKEEQKNKNTKEE